MHPGINLVKNDPPRATELLTKAWRQLETAGGAGHPRERDRPAQGAGPGRPRRAVQDGLGRGDDALLVRRLRSAGRPEGGRPRPGQGARTSSTGRPTRSTGSTSRAARPPRSRRSAEAVGGVKVAEPRFIALAGPDLLILDCKNVLWRWRPADKTGKGTLRKVNVKESSSWGDDIRAIGSFVRNADQGLYNLYVVDPSGKQILAYTPAFDGGGFPADPSGWLAAPQDVATVDAMVIDGDIYLSRSGTIDRFVRGGNTGWKPGDPGDALLRAAPVYSLIATGTDKDVETRYVYGYDKANRGSSPCARTTARSSGPVPAGQRRARLGRPARDVRPGRDGHRAGHARLDRQEPADELDPRRRPGAVGVPQPERRGQPVHLAEGQPRRRPRSRRRRPSRDPVIPLRDANPTRRTPVVTLAIIVVCFVTFALELAIQATGGEAGLTDLFETFGVVPADLVAALRLGSATRPAGPEPDHLPVPARRLDPHRGEHALPVDLRQQRRGPARPTGLPPVLPGRRGRSRPLAQVAIDPSSDVPLVGASGAIAAVLGAYVVMFPRARVLSIVFLVVFFQLTEVPSILVLGLWFVLQVIDGLASLGVDEVGRRRRDLRPHRAGSWPGCSSGCSSAGCDRGRSAPADRPARPAARAPWDNPAMAQLVEMVVESVRVHMPSSQHVVILKEVDRERYLPIWIGPWEANAIAMKLQGVSSGAAPDPRPVLDDARRARGDASAGS